MGETQNHRRVNVLHTADGTPYVRPYLGTDPATGRRVRPYREFPGMTDAEAEEAARAWLAAADAARRSPSLTVGELLRRYIDSLEARGAAPATVDAYRRAARRRTGRLSRADAATVTTEAVDGRILELLRGRGGARLSPQTVAQWRDLMHGAYRWAVSIGIMERNPVDGSPRPRAATTEARALDSDGARRLAAALADVATDRTRRGPRAEFARNAAAAALVSLHTGMRCGEALALRACDLSDPLGPPALWVRGTVTLDGGTPTRRPTTKGRKPRAVAISPALRSTLAEIHTARALETLYQLPPRRDAEDAPIFTTGAGWMNPKSVSRWFTRYARENGYPPFVTFHTLRHTHATMLLQAGIDPKAVQARLGHADVATTLRTYAHVMPARDAEAADAATRRLS